MILRNLYDSDKHELFFLRSNNAVNKYIERKEEKNISETLRFISLINKGIKQNKWIYWAICLKNNKNLIGTICLWNFSTNQKIAEIGYELNSHFQKQGIINEAINSIIDFAFNEIKLQEIEAYTHKKNISSKNLLVKNNFKINENRKDIDYINNIILSLKKNDFMCK
ncbi:MAG: GNAT family N-acetyltransferase [Bacteroidales bacterium]|nr:GNAT family N-acetyltransferase [Bacteroidales bacterium]MBN2756111.1 GNAT family N-acetyltransferase [Bacteroidales bacterium]